MKVDPEVLKALEAQDEVKKLKQFIDTNRVFSNYFKDKQEGKNPPPLGMWQSPIVQKAIKDYNEFCKANPVVVEMYKLYFE